MYALDVNVEKAEDVLTHKKLLQEAHDPAKTPVFDVRLVQVSPSSNGHNDDSINSSSPRTEVVQSIHPPPAFGSSPNLEALAIEANKDGDSATNACAKYLRPMHEITFSADDKPKLLSQVLKMEAKILNFLGFQLSVPTTKKFLRRFIQAAHINYKVPRVELEFLCNYLAELTLTGYTFLRFLPSHIVASVVFFARWILDQSQQPWAKTGNQKKFVVALQQLRGKGIDISEESAEIQGGYTVEQTSMQTASPNPFLCGSPPSRVSNPLIQDARFGDDVTQISPRAIPNRADMPISPTSSAMKGACGRANFGNNPVVRIEGFDCLDRDSRNCSIPTMA